MVDVRVERYHRNRRKTTAKACFDLGGGVKKVAILHLKNVSLIRKEEEEEDNDINRDKNTDQNDNEGDNTAAGEAEAGAERNPILLATDNNEEINVHGTIWTTEDNHTESVQSPINGAVIHRKWRQRLVTGAILEEGSDTSGYFSRLDYFLCMFPMKHLHQMVVRTNTVLHQRKKALTTDREVLKFFGVIILATKYEFESRAS